MTNKELGKKLDRLLGNTEYVYESLTLVENYINRVTREEKKKKETINNVALVVAVIVYTTLLVISLHQIASWVFP